MTLAARTVPLALGLMAFAAASAMAQDETGPRLSIELNATDPEGEGCKLSFLVNNGYEADVQSAVFETVIFDTAGKVASLTLFDFGTLPAGRPRVRQFVLPGATCDGLGRVLFNGASRCEAEGLEDGACTRGLDVTSRTGVEVLG
ncbi:hypothetical protein [Salipiger sp.]|uniref:hypothetical protein n=1 Tax=Salipiger sp. TaxID=2078585 RepID=UPI003A96DA66